MDVFDFPYHKQSTKYPENGTRVNLGGNYVFTAPPSGPDLRTFTLEFPVMFYYEKEPLLPEYFDAYNFSENRTGSPASLPSAPISHVTSLHDNLVYEKVNASLFLATRGVLSDLSKTYYVEVEYQILKIGGSDAPVLRASLEALDASYAAVGVVTPNSITVSKNGNYVVGGYVAATASTGVTAWPVGTVYLRPMANTGGTFSSGTIKTDVIRVTVIDATDYTSYPNPRIDRTVNPQYNMAVLEDFYSAHKMYRTFTYPHPIYGDVLTKFNSPLTVPKGLTNGAGALEDFTVELLEQVL